MTAEASPLPPLPPLPKKSGTVLLLSGDVLEYYTTAEFQAAAVRAAQAHWWRMPAPQGAEELAA